MYTHSLFEQEKRKTCTPPGIFEGSLNTMEHRILQDFTFLALFGTTINYLCLPYLQSTIGGPKIDLMFLQSILLSEYQTTRTTFLDKIQT